ncbi:uncharacterized protein ARMOST_11389 [Armillaria ostoyae]|uniref:Uncharacterized protein n=1 Tax=Armillaria ostoyae TaxID=47428 RepID=A0A284RH03_ARMOS|nr:uncharacterized protein ARMOST_11389 [Armillaria ostoyae]
MPVSEEEFKDTPYGNIFCWHTMTAKEDIKWTEDNFASPFQCGGEIDKSGHPRRFQGHCNHCVPQGRSGAHKSGLWSVRQTDATDKAAGAYRARGTPAALRMIEIMGMEQGRRWGCCTMNKFREFLGLAPFKSFSEWPTNPEIARTAELL